MNPRSTALAILMIFSIPAFAEPAWTYQTEQGEDATTTHDYFYESNGETIQRVRWVWNGGAQNPPTVTEYIMGSGKISVRRLTGKRADIPGLVTEKDAELELTEEYSLSAYSTDDMLVPAPPAKSLTKAQRIDLKNLIDLLARERKPYKKEPQPKK